MRKARGDSRPQPLYGLGRRQPFGWVRAAATALWAAVGLAHAPAVWADAGHPSAPRVLRDASAPDVNEARVIVKYRASILRTAAAASTGSTASTASAATGPARAASLSQRLSLPMADGRALGERTQVLKARGLDSAALVQRLSALADVEWAVVDQRRFAQAVVPNDPLYPSGLGGAGPAVGQWYLRSPDSTMVSATNAVGAWAVTTGSAALTVAVLDTGVRLDHPDLASKLWPGYDFIGWGYQRTSTSLNSYLDVANDGDLEDPDPSDPGDWSTRLDSCGEADSSWHGTQVAGLVGAATDNGVGMAGLARDVMVLPVRVLGQCGGYDSDIIAAMRWAGGIRADPYTNPHPARVLNLSLGSEGACPSSYQDVVNELARSNVVVVAASGNDVGQAVNAPANCSGVIAVAGIRHVGTKVGYSNIGPEVALAAPAGNCVNINTGSACLYPLLTTINDGLRLPATNTYSDSYYVSLGTSFATPLVAGAAALMLSVDPSLTPAEVRSTLRATSRTFPTTGGTDASVVACQAPDGTEQLECYCTTTTCGAGMLDVSAAVGAVRQALSAPTAVVNPASGTLALGATLTLSGTASSAVSGRSIVGWQWSVDASGRASIIGAADGQTVTVQADQAGSAVITLTVTDDSGQTDTAQATLTLSDGTTVTPVASSGSSGALTGPAGWLSGLGLLAAAAALRRRSSDLH